MHYILDDIVFEMRYCDRLERFERISKYYYVMKDLACSKSEIDNSNYALLKIFLEKEIDWEKRIYVKLKKWEERHQESLQRMRLHMQKIINMQEKGRFYDCS